MFMSVALSRVAPVLFPGMMDDGKVDAKVLGQVLGRLGSLAKGLNHEGIQLSPPISFTLTLFISVDDAAH
jgi:hypothetical protein